MLVKRFDRSLDQFNCYETIVRPETQTHKDGCIDYAEKENKLFRRLEAEPGSLIWTLPIEHEVHILEKCIEYTFNVAEDRIAGYVDESVWDPYATFRPGSESFDACSRESPAMPYKVTSILIRRPIQREEIETCRLLQPRRGEVISEDLPIPEPRR